MILWRCAWNLQVNVTGPIILFQAFYHLLKASAHPKFVPITSVGGSLAVTPQVPLRSTCYCSSKAMLNWVVRKIHFENEWLGPCFLLYQPPRFRSVADGGRGCRCI
jgi:NAD(P)-dependent dehydrogenase (short-subunit alcohol dehydrogenase family)